MIIYKDSTLAMCAEPHIDSPRYPYDLGQTITYLFPLESILTRCNIMS